MMCKIGVTVSGNGSGQSRYTIPGAEARWRTDGAPP